MTDEDDRQRAKLAGMRRAWSGIEDENRKAGIAFFINYAKTHHQFEGGDVLAAWRATGDPIAQLDWRNRWGAMCKAMSSAKWGVIKGVGRCTPKNVQSHGDYAMLWESLIYDGDNYE
jgi:hypothetical protein